MLTRLFTSKVRVEILGAFFSHPDKDLYVREIERITGADYRNVSKELRNLQQIGLLMSRKEGNVKYYSVNKHFLLFPELKSIFLKTRGIVAVLSQSLAPADVIEFAFIYGSVAAGDDTAQSDIDLMVVGDISLEELIKLLNVPEDMLGREINPSLYSMEEIKKRIRNEDSFIVNVMESPKIMLVGKENELRNIIA
jgi:predicted nucleotidyltransferase/predicted transcriptional regulator with HTH domain